MAATRHRDVTASAAQRLPDSRRRPEWIDLSVVTGVWCSTKEETGYTTSSASGAIGWGS
jgi:hypothetical protein